MMNNNNSLSNNSSLENKSLYIPTVLAHITKEEMMHTFERFDIGMVDHIDFVAKINPKGKVYNSAYVHFVYWYSNTSNFNLHDRLNNSLGCRIVYDDPSYWIILENKSSKKDYNIPSLKINLTGLKVDIKDNLKEDVKETLFLPRVLTQPGGPTTVEVKKRMNEKKLSSRDKKEILADIRDCKYDAFIEF